MVGHIIINRERDFCHNDPIRLQEGTSTGPRYSKSCSVNFAFTLPASWWKSQRGIAALAFGATVKDVEGEKQVPVSDGGEQRVEAVLVHLALLLVLTSERVLTIPAYFIAVLDIESINGFFEFLPGKSQC